MSLDIGEGIFRSSLSVLFFYSNHAFLVISTYVADRILSTNTLITNHANLKLNGFAPIANHIDKKPFCFAPIANHNDKKQFCFAPIANHIDKKQFCFAPIANHNDKKQNGIIKMWFAI